MKIHILYNYDDRVEGVFTAKGRVAKEQQLYDEALLRREKANATITREILELRELRQPYITEAEMLLDTERSAKEANNTGLLKDTRKQRKVLLKQAEKLTYEIQRREDRILASQRMLRSDLMNAYGDSSYWEEYYVEGEIYDDKTC